MFSNKFENQLTNKTFLSKNVFEYGILYGGNGKQGKSLFSQKILKF